jgi:hypothetical protein
MIEIWGVDDIAFKVEDIAGKMEALAAPADQDAALLTNGPAGKGEGLKQDDVDRMLGTRDARHGGPTFEPEPLTLAELHAVKRAALFG